MYVLFFFCFPSFPLYFFVSFSFFMVWGGGGGGGGEEGAKAFFLVYDFYLTTSC